jgi:hypothetical protein
MTEDLESYYEGTIVWFILCMLGGLVIYSLMIHNFLPYQTEIWWVGSEYIYTMVYGQLACPLAVAVGFTPFIMNIFGSTLGGGP